MIIETKEEYDAVVHQLNITTSQIRVLIEAEDAFRKALDEAVEKHPEWFALHKQ